MMILDYFHKTASGLLASVAFAARGIFKLLLVSTYFTAAFAGLERQEPRNEIPTDAVPDCMRGSASKTLYLLSQDPDGSEMRAVGADDATFVVDHRAVREIFDVAARNVCENNPSYIVEGPKSMPDGASIRTPHIPITDGLDNDVDDFTLKPTIVAKSFWCKGKELDKVDEPYQLKFSREGADDNCVYTFGEAPDGTDAEFSCRPGSGN